MEDIQIKIDEIYVPAARREEIKPEVVAELAESILAEGLKMPISVRKGNERYVLVSGLQRLEACKALGEETITAIVTAARQR